MMTKLAIWAAIFSALSWYLNTTLPDPRLLELAQMFNEWAALFALCSAIILLIHEHWKDWQEVKQSRQTRKDQSFARIISADPQTLSEWKRVDDLTNPDR